jgi:hypothetical protein
MSGIKHPVSLTFTDQVDFSSRRNYGGPAAMLQDDSELPRIIAYPLDWGAIETLQCNGSNSLPPVRILSELPISMHKMGLAMKNVHIDCFPRKGRYLHFRPVRKDRAEPAWDGLRAASQQLKLLHFRERGDLYKRIIRKGPLPDQEKACIDAYLGAMVSGSCLEDIVLQMYCVGTSGDLWLG